MTLYRTGKSVESYIIIYTHMLGSFSISSEDECISSLFLFPSSNYLSYIFLPYIHPPKIIHLCKVILYIYIYYIKSYICTLQLCVSPPISEVLPHLRELAQISFCKDKLMSWYYIGSFNFNIWCTM